MHEFYQTLVGRQHGKRERDPDWEPKVMASVSGSAIFCKPHNLTETHFLHLNVLDWLVPKDPLGFMREGKWWVVQKKGEVVDSIVKQALGTGVSLNKHPLLYFTMADFSCDLGLSSSLLGGGPSLIDLKSPSFCTCDEYITYHMMTAQMFNMKGGHSSVSPPLILSYKSPFPNSAISEVQDEKTDNITHFLKYLYLQYRGSRFFFF